MDEQLVVDLARTQHGLISRAQAQSLGMTGRMIEGRTATGRWRIHHPGVYVVGATPSSWEQRVLAICLAAGPDLVASHRTAARLWGLVSADGRPEFTVAGRRRVRIPRARFHRSLLLPEIDQTVRCAIPVTTLPRTLVDASSHQDPQTVGTWVDGAIRTFDLDLRAVRSCLARLSGPGRRHVGSLQMALVERLPGYDPGDSELEARAMRALAAAGLPSPVQQHPVRRSDGRMAYIDLAYPAQSIAIELDGWDFHGRRSAFDPDRVRRNELTLLGWDVYQFTASMSDDLMTRTVATALAAPNLGRPATPAVGE